MRIPSDHLEALARCDAATQLTPSADPTVPAAKQPPAAPEPEIGGPSGPEPTRYGDWERNGRCIDF
jgi:hypothetical protein